MKENIQGKNGWLYSHIIGCGMKNKNNITGQNITEQYILEQYNIKQTL